MRINVLGCPVDNLTMSETVELAQRAMKTRKRIRHVAMNVAKLVNMRSDPVLAADVLTSDVIGVDGVGILLAARCLGVRVIERVTGIDLFNELLMVCATEGFRPYFLGATSEVLGQAVERSLAKFPSLQFAGTQNGYFRVEQECEVVENIARSGADCLFIAMPTPRKERFLAMHMDRLEVPFVMGVGGSFDILAGHVRRAPRILQAIGLEWFYRLAQEPRRLWWRYTRTNFIFAGMLFRGMIEMLARR